MVRRASDERKINRWISCIMMGDSFLLNDVGNMKRLFFACSVACPSLTFSPLFTFHHCIFSIEVYTKVKRNIYGTVALLSIIMLNNGVSFGHTHTHSQRERESIGKKNSKAYFVAVVVGVFLQFAMCNDLRLQFQWITSKHFVKTLSKVWKDSFGSVCVCVCFFIFQLIFHSLSTSILCDAFFSRAVCV